MADDDIQPLVEFSADFPEMGALLKAAAVEKSQAGFVLAADCRQQHMKAMPAGMILQMPDRQGA